VHRSQLRPGLDAQRLDQQPPAVLVHGQGLGPPPGPLQRQHEQAAEPLAERVRPHQREQVTGQLLVAAKIQLQAHALLGDQQPPFLQPGRLDLGEWPVDAAQRRPAPQRQADPQQPGGRRAVTRSPRVAGLPGALLETPGIEPAARYQVPRGNGGDDLTPGPGRGERLAEPADADRHLMAGGGGRVIVPQRLGQPVARDHLAVFH
jgi:hypothetical protein